MRILGTATLVASLALSSLGCATPFSSGASRLDEIVRTKRLRVGTTGDYAPFSSRETNGEYRGVDIDLARELARSLDAELELVPTSWPDLMQDLERDRFDVAMSGISKDLGRQRKALFSESYYVDGKTPLARCTDRAKYGTLAGIDRPDVRVIVNPGGTNQKFANAQLSRAKVLVHPDNVTVFQEIITGRADVMITDAVEATLQAKRHPELCRTMPRGTLNRSEKAVLLGRDHVLKEYVDAWLAQIRGSGGIEKAFRAHL